MACATEPRRTWTLPVFKQSAGLIVWRPSRDIDVTRPSRRCRTLALCLEMRKQSADGRITGRSGQGREDLRRGGLAPGMEDIHESAARGG